MLLWPAFWNDLQDPLETRETGQNYNHAARARTRSTVLEVLKNRRTKRAIAIRGTRVGFDPKVKPSWGRPGQISSQKLRL